MRCDIRDERKLKLMRNEVPCGKLPKVRFDGRRSPFSTARSDGGPKGSKLVGCARPEVFWEIGSTSTKLSMVTQSKSC